MCLIGTKWWEFGLHEKIIKLAWGLPIPVIHEAAEHAQTLANQRFVRYFAIDCISTTKFRSFFKKIEATRFIKINPEFRAATDDEIDDFIIKVAFSIDSI